MNIQLKKFAPENMPDDKVCVFIGKRGTGKSTLVTDILYHKKHIPIGVCMSATEEGNHFYQQFIPDLFIYPDYDRETIEKVLDRQKAVISAGKKNPGAFLLLDDCMYDKKFVKDVCIRQCFMNGRHWKIFFMLTMQYCMDLTPDLRANVDYVFILRENVIQNREKLYKSFFGIFPNFDMFSQVMSKCTEDYECLVLDNTAKSNRIEDCVFWYKAKVRKNFRVGSPAMWNAHKKNYTPTVHKAPQGRDPNTVLKHKKSEELNIIKRK
tara:strand:+ start:4973 stop:5770 length:798 start_codon:yes stop_codon:yes gene_type:complete